MAALLQVNMYIREILCYSKETEEPVEETFCEPYLFVNRTKKKLVKIWATPIVLLMVIYYDFMMMTINNDRIESI